MKILITGGTSSVARFLIPLLISEHEIITLGRKNCDINCDLKELNVDLLPANVDIIVHTAASFGGDSSDSIRETEEFNVIATLNLCTVANELNISHFIHVSSIFSLIDSSSIFYNIYSISKRHSEEIVKFCLNKYEIDYTILRPSQLYGNDPIFRKNQPFFYNIIDLASSGERVKFFGTNSPKRNYLHIKDLVSIISKVVDNKVYGEYNCLYQSNTTYEEIATLAYEISNNKPQIEFDVKKPDMPDNIFDIDSNLYERIDFYPQVTLIEGITEIIQKNK